MTGQRPPELDGPECPPPLLYLWEWFLELSAARGSGGFGPNPISYCDIADWARLYARDPQPFEVRCLVDIDREFMTLKAGQAGTRGNS